METKQFLLKRKQKPFQWDQHLLKEAHSLIQEIWANDQVNDCKLHIFERGGSSLINGGFNRNGLNSIHIVLVEEWKHYQHLLTKGLFAGDFLRFIKFSTYREIGYKKDEQHCFIKQQISVIRNQMVEATNQEKWENLRKSVWDKTFEIEMNAWNYAERYLLPEEREDFHSYRYYGITRHYNHWMSNSKIHLYSRYLTEKVSETSGV